MLSADNLLMYANKLGSSIFHNYLIKTLEKMILSNIMPERNCSHIETPANHQANIFWGVYVF